MNEYLVKKLRSKSPIEVDLPASKSVLNRALLLAALSHGNTTLRCGALCEDTRVFLDCLSTLGIECLPLEDGFLVRGCGGVLPNRTCSLDVKNSGTAARFLPAVLAFCGGDYTFTCSRQMKSRPMSFLSLFNNSSVKILFQENENSFPFRLLSKGLEQTFFSVNTEESSQYASALLMAASISEKPVTIQLTGRQKDSRYLRLTLETMSRFSIPYSIQGDEVTVFRQTDPSTSFQVEPDLSSACYFCATALLCRTKIFLNNVRLSSSQPDIEFIYLLKDRGLVLTEFPNGLLSDGSNVSEFAGFQEDFSNISDQALTAAALAPFASTPSRLKNIGHIRFQECDRIQAIVKNLNRLHVKAFLDRDDVVIEPSQIESGIIETFDDHRVAMAFAMIGLKTGNIIIDNPECCKKTFENFFEILNEIT